MFKKATKIWMLYIFFIHKQEEMQGSDGKFQISLKCAFWILGFKNLTVYLMRIFYDIL